MSGQILLQLNNASFAYPSHEVLFKELTFNISSGEVTALVGINGAGKTTLLKLLTGELKPTDGTIEINCKPYYVPQIDLTIQQGDSLIYEYISNYYENWWELNSETERLFGLSINTEAQTKTLSGGELMKLNLAIALKNNPDVLILDEPTNHLDVKSVANLIDFIKTSSKTKYTFLIVSHDTFFLDSVVKKILNLDNKTITTYGGNYSFYEEQKELHLRGLKRHQDIAKHKLENAKITAQQELEKNQRKAAKTRKDIAEGKITDKRLIGKMKESAGATAKANTTIVERIVDEATETIDEFQTPEERELAFMYLKNTSEKNSKVVLELLNTDLVVEDKILIKDMSWQINYGDRIVIAGDNGVGKTSLIKALLKFGNANAKDTILGEARLEGQVTVTKNHKWVYIDQNYSSIHPELTLLQNLMAYNPAYTEDMAKAQLGKFKFKTVAEINKLGKTLSGGEMVRVIMAMITAFPIDMVILDEPTNNLDIDTVNTLATALSKFRGAIVVISHNVDFLNKININTAYIIKNNNLQLLKVNPTHRESYYKALLS